MKRSEIEVGGMYTAKVAGKLTTVKIVTDHGCRSTYSSIGFYRDTRITEKHGGWEAINLNTKHQVHIRSAARLRKKVEVLAFYRDIKPTLIERHWTAGPKQITRAEAVALVHETFGVGTWLENLRKMRSVDGLEIKGGTLRARPESAS